MEGRSASYRHHRLFRRMDTSLPRFLTHFDGGQARNAEDKIEQQSSRPDLGILCYGVITMGDFTHKGSKKICWAIILTQIRRKPLKRTPGHERHAAVFYLAYGRRPGRAGGKQPSIRHGRLAKAGVPFDLHIYEKGPHGLGLAVAIMIPLNGIHGRETVSSG